MKSMRDLALGGKRLFLRVDFNVPIEAGRITDAGRTPKPSRPSVRVRAGARVVCASHLASQKPN
jgi:phosphoglycerate kinase